MKGPISCALAALLVAAGAAPAQQPIPAPLLKPFADNREWVLFEDMRYRIGETSTEIVVPKGFVTDFASIPEFLWSFGLSAHGRYSKAAIVHDWLYWSQGCSRRQADNLLVIAMRESLVGEAAIDVIYRGVRAGGGPAWRGNAAQKAQGLPRVLPERSLGFGPNVTWAEYREQLAAEGVADPQLAVDALACAIGDGTEVPREPVAAASPGAAP